MSNEIFQKSYFSHSGPFLPKRSRKWEEKDFFIFTDLRFSGILKTLRLSTRVDAKNRNRFSDLATPTRMPTRSIREKRDRLFLPICYYASEDLVIVTLLGVPEG